VPSMVDKAITAASSQTVQLPGQDTTTTTTAVLIANLARQMLDLDRQIKHTTKLITERFRVHPYPQIIESLPGLGPILGADSGNLGRPKRYNRWLRPRVLHGRLSSLKTEDRPGCSTTANAPNVRSTPKPCSPWPDAWSTPLGCTTRPPHLQPDRTDPAPHPRPLDDH
jgi:hypothetical protein